MDKNCVSCGRSFFISDTDLAFYEEVSPVFNGKKYPVPPPGLCPDCRYQRRLSWRNERTLYRRKCDATGKEIVSIFSPEKEWPPVYEQPYWWSDQWDPKEYGRDFDFNRSFFEQFAELWREVPQIALNNQQSENCEFTNQSQRNKDCYMITCTDRSRDCMFSMWLQRSENCSDCLYLEKGELCYEILSGKNCYRCTFSRNLENCNEVHFSKNCIGCKECFGCINLRNKQYFFFNEKCSKEEYQQRLAALEIHKHASIQAAHKKVDDFMQSYAHKYYVGDNNENFSGDYVTHTKNTFHSFNCRNAENMHYCQDAWNARNNYDLTETVENDYCYSLEGCGTSTNALFCMKFTGSHNTMYCSHCNFSKHLFGCVSMNHAEYCILNKQYSKDEYEDLAGKIIDHMVESGEWGQHFPPQYSPFGYNESVAQEYFPLTKKETEAKGWKWRDHIDEVPDVEKIIPADKLPESIEDVPDDILNWAIQCEATNRPFRIIKQELDFYRRMHLPIPHLHPDERHAQRMAKRNPRKLWQRKCDVCGVELGTTYAPERKEKVLCEGCYLKEVD